MQKRIPYTEPLTPDETAELADAMQATRAQVRANTERLVAEHLDAAWTDAAEGLPASKSQTVPVE